jgi:hypothetical protein
MEAEAQVQLAPTVGSTHSMVTPQRCLVGSGYRRLPALRLVCNTTSHADNAFVNQTLTEASLQKPTNTSTTPLPSTPAPCLPHAKAVRERRSSRKALRPPPSPPRKATPKAKDAEKLVKTENDKPKRSRGPKSNTFKMAWSVEEQRLLERLLEEIPDGEKNRLVPFASVHQCQFWIGNRLKVGEDFASDEWTANASASCEQGPEVFRETQEVRNRGTITSRFLWSGA